MAKVAKDSGKKYKPSPPPVLEEKDEEKPYRFNQNDNAEGRKTIVLIGVLLVLILLVGGALVYIITARAPPTPPANTTNQTHPVPPPSNGTSITPPPSNTTNSTSNLTNVTCDDQCHLANALGSVNASECLKIQNQSVSQGCLLQLSNSSVDACEALQAEAEKDSCLIPFAIARNDSSLCGQLSGAGKDRCMAVFNPCSGASEKSLCEAISSKNPGLCDSNDCIMNYSAATKDSHACGLVNDTVKSKACLSAATGLDHCTDLNLSSQQDYCYELYAVYTDNHLICTEIKWDDMYSLDCDSYFAARLKNLSVCDNGLLSLNSLWDCYTNYSMISDDPSGCANIDPLASTSRFQCAFAFAKKYGDPSACVIITDSLAQRNTCYEGAIIYTSTKIDWTKCGGVVDTNYQNLCYTDAAKQYANESICDMIQQDNSVESCKNSFAINQSAH